MAKRNQNIHMNEPIKFFVPCVPPSFTSQMKGAFAMPGGKGIRFFKKPEAVAAERTWIGLLHGHSPRAPFEGPISLTLGLTFPWRKSEKKSVIREYVCMPIETRPDIDNVAKLALDVMVTLRFFSDDAQIAALQLTKHYGDKPGILIHIHPLTGEKRIDPFDGWRETFAVTLDKNIAEPEITPLPPRPAPSFVPQEPTSPFDE